MEPSKQLKRYQESVNEWQDFYNKTPSPFAYRKLLSAKKKLSDFKKKHNGVQSSLIKN